MASHIRVVVQLNRANDIFRPYHFRIKFIYFIIYLYVYINAVLINFGFLDDPASSLNTSFPPAFRNLYLWATYGKIWVISQQFSVSKICHQSYFDFLNFRGEMKKGVTYFYLRRRQLFWLEAQWSHL